MNNLQWEAASPEASTLVDECYIAVADNNMVAVVLLPKGDLSAYAAFLEFNDLRCEANIFFLDLGLAMKWCEDEIAKWQPSPWVKDRVRRK